MIIVPGSAFFLKAASDPYWANVVLLMHMDTDSFVDEKGHTVTKFSSPTVQPGVFGNALFSDNTVGQNDWLLVNTDDDLKFVTSDFTIEFFFKPSAMNVAFMYFQSNAFSILMLGDGSIVFSSFTSGNVWTDFSTPAGVIDTSKFYHVAITSEVGGNNQIFIDGVQKASRASPTFKDNALGTPFGIYVHQGAVDGTLSLKGYSDEFRITKGVARYTADFTVPSTPFPNS